MRATFVNPRPERARSAWCAPLQGALCAEPGLSARDLIECETRMSSRLRSHVSDGAPKISHAEGPEIVTIRPTQRGTGHHAVAVRDARAGTLQPLDEPWDVHVRWELKNQVDVVADDSDIDHPRSVAPGDLR